MAAYRFELAIFASAQFPSVMMHQDTTLLEPRNHLFPVHDGFFDSATCLVVETLLAVPRNPSPSFEA